MDRHLGLPLLGVVLTVALLLGTRGLDQVVLGDQLGPSFWPRVVLAGLGFACLARVAGGVRRRRADSRAVARPADIAAGEPTGLAEIRREKLAVAIGLILLYALLAPLVGFALATAGFIAGFMWVCGVRSTLAIVANVLVGTAGLLYLFIKLVYLPLPKGAGPFETATLALYRALHLF